MKFKYFFVMYGDFYYKQSITREDLVNVRDRRYEFLIDAEKGLYFDADDNEWKAIEEKS